MRCFFKDCNEALFFIESLKSNYKEIIIILRNIIQMFEKKSFYFFYCFVFIIICLCACACARRQATIVDSQKEMQHFETKPINHPPEFNEIDINNRYEIGMVNQYLDSLKIEGDIKKNEWKKGRENTWHGKLLTFNYYQSNSKMFVKKGLQKEAVSNGKHMYLLTDKYPSKTQSRIMLNVFVHGIQNRPELLKFHYRSTHKNSKNNVEKLSRNNFSISNQKPDRIQIGVNDPDQPDCPEIHLFYFSNNYYVHIKGIDLIKNTLENIAYIEISHKNIIILTLKISGKETTIPFSTETYPTKVRFVSRFGRIDAKPDQNNKQLFEINLFPLIKTIVVKDSRGKSIENANVNVKLNVNKKQSISQHKIFSMFGSFGRIFSKPETPKVNPILTSSQTDHDGKAYFLSWNYSYPMLSIDVFKQGYIGIENQILFSNGKILLSEDKTQVNSLIFDFKPCMNENIDVHKSKGQLNIYENGAIVGSLKPDVSEVLPFVNQPQYSYYHPSYIYNTVFNHFTGIFEIFPTQFNQKLKNNTPEQQILIIMDVTDDDPKGRAFIKTCSALKRYLYEIKWETFSISKKKQFRIATAYHDHLNYISSIDSINYDLLMVQADSSFTEQLKKAFTSFQNNKKCYKKVIYMISSKRATIVPNQHLVDLFNIDKMNNEMISFNAIIIGDYGGMPLSHLAQKTYGQCYWCLTDDLIYSRLNQIISPNPIKETKNSILCNTFLGQ